MDREIYSDQKVSFCIVCPYRFPERKEGLLIPKAGDTVVNATVQGFLSRRLFHNVVLCFVHD